jgi:hypothetical protein
MWWIHAFFTFNLVPLFREDLSTIAGWFNQERHGIGGILSTFRTQRDHDAQLAAGKQSHASYHTSHFTQFFCRVSAKKGRSTAVLDLLSSLMIFLVLYNIRYFFYHNHLLALLLQDNNHRFKTIAAASVF